MTPGDRLPDTMLVGADGPLRLADLHGRPLVLFVYPRDDTAGCTREAGDFSALMPRFDALGVAVFGLSPDTQAKHAAFTAKHGLIVPLVSDDAERSTLIALGAWGERSLYGRRYMGVTRTTYLFDAEGRLARHWPKVRVAGHADAVLAAAEMLVAG